MKPFEASYTYDLNSNRIQKVIASVDENDTINYAYNANDQLTSEVSSANGTTVYTYDANGSLTTKINVGKSINCQYGYDLRNRLVSANITRMEGTTPNQPQKVDITSNYAYNADGIRTRVTQTVGGVTQKRYFLLDEGLTGYSQVLEETSSLGGNMERSYVIGDDVLSQTVGGITSHLLYDGHGSTRQLANENGGISDNYSYDAYGKMLGGDPNVTDNQSVTDLLYAGEQFDAGLQMEYLRARYYDQSTGRFNRLDPFAGNTDDPQSLHKYAYAHCDPVNSIDPSGNFGILQVALLMGALSCLSTFAYLRISLGTNLLTASTYALLAGILTTLAIFFAPIIIAALAASALWVQASFAVIGVYFMVMSAYALSDALSIAFSDKYSFKQRLAAGFFAASQLATWIVSATFARGHFPTGSSPSSTQSGALAGGPKLIMRVPQGKQFTQVVGPQQSKPGSWVTTVEFATEELARSKLALLSVHKSKVYGNATVKVDAPSVSAEIGIVGPQENFPGGAIQFMFRDPVSGKPSNSGLIFTTDPVVPMQ